jgi:hypothetical protein
LGRPVALIRGCHTSARPGDDHAVRAGGLKGAAIRRPTVVALLVATIGLAGCTWSGTPQRGSPDASAPTTAPATAGDAASSPSDVLADGHHPVYLKTVDPNERMITFDLIQFYVGEDAAREATKDHKEFFNDYYIRNVSPRLRSLPVRAGAIVIINTLAADATGSAIKDSQVSLAKLATWFPRTGGPPFWITVEHGEVVRIAEQFIP